MLYDVDTPEAYLEALENDWRKDKLLKIRSFILDNIPEIDEGIQYKMLSYGKKELTLFHLNAQKNYVSLYVGDHKKIDPNNELLNGLDCGKGCIRIKKSIEIEQTGLENFIIKAITLWRQGEDLSC